MAEGGVAADGAAMAGSMLCAYIADGASGLRIHDVTDPADPQEVGFVDTPGFVQGVVISGTYAYIADWTSSSGSTIRRGAWCVS
jgi:hypothetical protein